MDAWLRVFGPCHTQYIWFFRIPTTTIPSIYTPRMAIHASHTSALELSWPPHVLMEYKNGSPFSNVIHALNIGCRFISICKIGKRGISTTFTNNTVTLSSNGIDYAEGHLLGQQYWLTLQAPAPSANAVQCGIPIETLHTQDLVTYSGQHCRNSVVKLIQTPNKLSQHVKGVY